MLEMAFVGKQLCDQVIHNLAALVGQSDAESFIRHGKPSVVEAKLMKNSSVQVVDVNRVFDDRPANVIGFAVCQTTLEAAAGHPDAESERMMVAAEFEIVLAPLTILAQRRAAKFACKNQ